nr:centromere protein 3 [Quercus suber]
MARHDLEKENRPPNNMAPSVKGSQTALTPGRRKKTQDQYFDFGKVGRKTGITLKDTGLRDEHGLEPVEGIFSSPALPDQRSGQDVDQTLHLRKTPKLPPPRQATPKHTNIGSPKRMSSARPQTRGGSAAVEVSDRSPASHLSKTQPPPNRILDFAPSKIVKSIEPNSPFKPKKNLRRSLGPVRPNPFASQLIPVDANIDAIEEAENENTEEDVALPTMSGALQEDLDHEQLPAMDSPVQFGDAQDAYQMIEDESIPDLSAGEKNASVHKSSVRLSSVPAPESPWQPGSRKRNRDSYETQHEAQEAIISRRQSQRNQSHSDDQEPIGSSISPINEEVEDDFNQTIDPDLLQVDEGTTEENGLEQARKQSKKLAPKSKAGKRAAFDVSDASGPSKQRSSTNRGARSGSAGAVRASAGPTSKFNLRATTPFEDAGGRVSRFGRTLIEPLKFWANETKVYRHGEMDGIIRAEEIPEKPKKKSKKKPGRKPKHGSNLNAIEEDSEAESCHPDEWEDELGVLAGFVAKWDPETQEGNAQDPIKEASAIIQRDVPGSNFSFAKILTSSFFGSGMVELPPSGYKSVKNSRNMELVFFVAQGKVMVEIGTEDFGPNQFAISAGGCWVVPRGEFQTFIQCSVVIFQRSRMPLLYAWAQHRPEKRWSHCSRVSEWSASCCATELFMTDTRLPRRLLCNAVHPPADFNFKTTASATMVATFSVPRLHMTYNFRRCQR